MRKQIVRPELLTCPISLYTASLCDSSLSSQNIPKTLPAPLCIDIVSTLQDDSVLITRLHFLKIFFIIKILSLPVHYAIQHTSKIKNFAASIALCAMLAVWLLKQPSQIAYISEPKSNFTGAFYW